MAILIELLVSLIVQLVAEVLFVGFCESVAAAFRKRPRANAALACTGYVVIGFTLGVALALLYPHRLSQSTALSILGVLLNAAGLGALLHYYGASRRRAGKTTTNLSTFWGGASLALGISLGRLAVLMSG